MTDGAVEFIRPPAGEARAALIARGAAQWRDSSSAVRTHARRALAGGAWSAPAVEAALDNVLWDLDETRAAELVAQTPELRSGTTVLVVLPGNIIGPAIQSAFCAAVAGARAILKAPSSEPDIARIVAEQFAHLGPPLAGSVETRSWAGGDLDAEAAALAGVERLIVFGEDETIRQISARADDAVAIIGYGESYSIGFVPGGSDLAQAAEAAARDVCLFDQRGCMSPQSIYIEGDRGRSVLFAHALARALDALSRILPCAPLQPGEATLVSDFVRQMNAVAIEALPHGLDTVLRGPARDGVPGYCVSAEAFGQPTCAGFGRLVSVKPCPDARDVVAQLKHYGRAVESIGVAAGTTDKDLTALRASGALRLCTLGEMQRPPFGYRPKIRDFER